MKVGLILLFFSFCLILFLILCLDFFTFTKKALTSGEICESEVEFSSFMDLPVFANCNVDCPLSLIIDKEYWSAKSFPKIKGVVIPLTR